MMKYLFVLISLFIISCQHAPNYDSSDQMTIREVMKDQEDAWNDANLEKFMEGYHKSDSLMFIGRTGVTYGWQNVLGNYKKSYSNPEKMGSLHFEIIHLDKISADSYRMVGSYALQYPEDTQKGFFTLIWQKINGEWLITSDHTSG